MLCIFTSAITRSTALHDTTKVKKVSTCTVYIIYIYLVDRWIDSSYICKIINHGDALWFNNMSRENRHNNYYKLTRALKL